MPSIQNPFLRKFFSKILLVSCIAQWGLAQESQEKRDFVYGEKLYNEGFYELASVQFEGFIRDFSSSPKSADAQFLLSDCQFNLKHFETAREAYLKMILTYPSSPNLDKAQFRIAECFEKENTFSAAFESYYRVHLYYPKSKLCGESLLRCARLAVDMKNLDKAESILKLFFETEPSGEMRSKAIFMLSEVFLGQEQYERAVAILNPLLVRPIQEKDAAKAMLMAGRIYESQGRYEESLSQYGIVAASVKNPDIQALAEYHRGILLKMEGKDRDASTAFQKAISGLNDETLKNECIFAQAQIALRNNQFQAALEHFNQISISGRGSDKDVLFEKAGCYEKLNRYQEAIQACESILEDSASGAEFKKKGLLLLAHLLTRSSQFEGAIQIYNQYIEHYNRDPLKDSVLFQKAKIYLDSLDSFQDAYIVFQKLWEDYPESPFIPESRFVVAEKLNRLGRHGEARGLFRQVFNRYPGTSWAENAAMKYNEIEWLNDNRFQNGFAGLTRFLTHRDSSYYQLGLIFFQDFNQFRVALDCFNKFLVFFPDSVKADSALFFRGACFEALAKKENQPAFIDSASHCYQGILAKSIEGPLNESALLRLTLLAKDLSSQDRFKKLSEIKQRYPGVVKKDAFLFTLGKTAMECDSLHQAMESLQEFFQKYPLSPYAEEALFRQASISEMQGNARFADSLLTRYAKNFPKGRFIPQILYLQAKTHYRTSQLDKSVSLLEELNRSFAFSNWADSGSVLLGHLYLELKKYPNAVDLFQFKIRQDSLASFAESVGLRTLYFRQEKNILFKLAQAYEGLGQYRKAKQLYFEFGKTADRQEEKAVFYTALSRVCEKESNLTEAAIYLDQVVQILPSDSTYQSLGFFHFRSDHYSEAIAAWNQAMELTLLYSKKAFLKSRILIAGIKMDQTSQTETRIKEFEKTYTNDPSIKGYISELYLELAKSCTRQKEFDLALKYLKEVQKNKDSAFYPESEVEIGKVLLITNKIDKALELLTELPKRYPGNPILAKVYLNLGDHYFRSQQFENAISAFKKAAEDSTDKEGSAVAFRYLIKIYDALQMWDAALALTRKYIRSFPNAEDILEKRIQIGVFCVNIKEYFLALDAFREVHKDATEETDAEIQYWIAKCYYEMGQFEQAILEFLKVKYVSKPTNLPWAATALFEAGTAYLRLKDPEKARKMFQKIVASEGAASDLGRIAAKRVQEIDSGNP